MDKIDLGKYKLCTNWEDVKLKQWSDYLRLTSEQGEVDILTTLECFSDIPREVIYQIPSDLFEKVIQKMKFLNEEPNIESSNIVLHNGNTYHINVMEKLRVKEYLDLNTILENDKYNYPVIFAILCRLDNEEYNEEYIADILEKRVQMWEDVPVTKALPLISFFLHLWNEYAQHTQSCLMVKHLKSELIEYVKNVKNSLKLGDYIIPSRVRQIMTLRKLEKYLKNI